MPKRKTYRKPKIVYQKEIETLAGVCTSAWINPDIICQKTEPCQLTTD